MATTGTYYYSSASFSTATALYLDAALSSFAPDGWYSDQSIVRQQASGVLFAEDDCPDCSSPTPPPTPVVYDYRVYTACDGVSSSQVFRLVQGSGTFPPTVSYLGICYHNPSSTTDTSFTNVNGLVNYNNCTECGSTPTPTPTPPAANVPVLTTNSSTNVTGASFTANGSLNTANGTVTSRGFYIGTDPSYLNNTQYVVGGTAIGSFTYNFSGATSGTTYYVTAYAVNENGIGVGATITTLTPITYDFREYTLCSTSTCGGASTKVFRLVTGSTFPTVVKDGNCCYDNESTTTSTSTNDINFSYGDCATCEASTPSPTPTPTPTPSPTPTPAPGTKIFSTNTSGNGQTSPSNSCISLTSISMFTSRADVASIVTGDFVYTDSGLSNAWNGQLKWYGVTDATGKYPNPDSGYALLIRDVGEVIQIVDCNAVTPSPTPTPAPTFQDVEIRKCFTTTPTYKVRVTGLSSPFLGNSNAIKITGVASAPNPAFTNTDCWEVIDNAATSYDSSVTFNSAYFDCSACGAIPQYDYATYTECQTSITAVFRKLSTTASFPTVVKDNNICYSNAQSTTATSNVSVESLTSFVNCYDCESPSMFINGLPQGGYSLSAACNARTDYFVFSNRATVAQIVVGDILYANSSKTTVFDGGLEYFSISNTLGFLPQSANDKYLINSSGEVLTILSCSSATPPPTPAPTPAPTTNIQVRDCANASRNAFITVAGNYASNAIGVSLRITGGAGGSCQSGFDGSKCWEIIAVNTGTDCSVTTLNVYGTCGGCTPTTPTPSPTPTPTPTPTPPSTIYGRYLDCNDPSNTLDVSAPFGTTFPNVLLSGTICFEFDSNAGSGVNGSYALYTPYSLCFDCQNPPTPSPTPAPTPRPTPTPACNAVSLEYISQSGPSPVPSFTCNVSSGYYMNTTDFCTATLLYRDSACTSAAYAGYYNTGTYYRFWNGSSFTLSCTITNCP